MTLTPGYMVHDELWAAHGNGKGILCVGCFEARLGRSLEIGDLKPVPLNAGLVHGYGMALIERGEAEWPVRMQGEIPGE